jgi:hypothetical protein
VKRGDLHLLRYDSPDETECGRRRALVRTAATVQDLTALRYCCEQCVLARLGRAVIATPGPQSAISAVVNNT